MRVFNQVLYEVFPKINYQMPKLKSQYFKVNLEVVIIKFWILDAVEEKYTQYLI